MPQSPTYERAASILITIVLLGGSGVLVLFLLWLSTFVLAPHKSAAVLIVPVGVGGGDPNWNESDPNVLDSGDEMANDEPTFLESVEMLDLVVSKNIAVLTDSTPFNDPFFSFEGKRGDGRTKGDGTGPAGPPRRWEVRFGVGLTIDQYARMLDSFGIELGVLMPGGKVKIISQLAAKKPLVKEIEASEEERYYLTWIKEDENAAADRTLIDKAGVDHRGHLILRFLPKSLEEELLRQEVEQSEKAGRVGSVQSSYFRVVNKENDKYQFEIYHQIY
ncbi:MAG: hypothetical protein ACRCUY_03445 [Thermoguttaceae bacterium]